MEHDSRSYLSFSVFRIKSIAFSKSDGSQWAKSPKTQSEGGTQNTVPCCQKYTPRDWFFGDFAHWAIAPRTGKIIKNDLDVFENLLQKNWRQRCL